MRKSIALGMTLLLVWVSIPTPTWARFQSGARVKPFAARIHPSNISSWYIQTLDLSQKYDSTFGHSIRANLSVAFAQMRENPGAPALKERFSQALDLMKSRPDTLSAQQASDVFAVYLLARPQQAKEALLHLAQLEPAILGEVAALWQDNSWRKDAPNKTLQKTLQKKLAAIDPLASRGKWNWLGTLFDRQKHLGPLHWQGRTAVLAMDDGTTLAIKLRKPKLEKNGDLDVEAKNMHALRSWGMFEVPEPLVDSQGSFERIFHAQTSGILYRAPKEYFLYLNDKMPKSMKRGERASLLKESALKSIKQMAFLLQRGYVHETLAAFSHSEARWRWNYFRFTILRFGPTSIHAWRKQFLYSNLRYTGLADWAHLVKLAQPQKGINFSVRNQKLEESGNIKYVDSHLHTLMGQNLTEWALLTLHSAAVNRLPIYVATEIVLQGLYAYAAQARGETALKNLPWAEIRLGIQSTARRVKLFRFVPYPLMPGRVFHPLVVQVIWPMVDNLSGRQVKPIDYTAYIMGTGALANWFTNATIYGLIFLFLGAVLDLVFVGFGFLFGWDWILGEAVIISVQFAIALALFTLSTLGLIGLSQTYQGGRKLRKAKVDTN